MKSTLSYLLIICSLFTACIGHQEESLLFYVDTRTGTAPSATHTAELSAKLPKSTGKTPACCSRAQRNELLDSPDTRYRNKMQGSLLLQRYENTRFPQFTLDCRRLYTGLRFHDLMPVSGTLKYLPQDRGSLFSHQEETATPAYYSVLLKDYSIFAEMTGRSRSAIFRFTYNQPEDAYLIVNPNSDEGERIY